MWHLLNRWFFKHFGQQSHDLINLLFQPVKVWAVIIEVVRHVVFSANSILKIEKLLAFSAAIFCIVPVQAVMVAASVADIAHACTLSGLKRIITVNVFSFFFLLDDTKIFIKISDLYMVVCVYYFPLNVKVTGEEGCSQCMWLFNLASSDVYIYTTTQLLNFKIIFILYHVSTALVWRWYGAVEFPSVP